jgi:nitrite reductase/ring-hydroxylating ferredoxin subunit/uncharacterized membrane protein
VALGSDLHGIATRLGAVSGLDRVATPAAGFVKRTLGHGPVKDALSGTWLGHPLHPLLTDIPIGSFTSATVLDVVGGRRARGAADSLVALGLVSAVPTALAGTADWSDTYGHDQRVGVVHAASNALGLAFYASSLRARRRGARARGTVLALLGMTSMTVGGYLGGYLAYSRGVGVNNAFTEEPPDEWTAVDDRGRAGDATVFVHRSSVEGVVRAIGGRCSHAGGPLAEGAVDDARCTVTCPWHGSVFRMDDGAVVHGPATVPQVVYDARDAGGSAVEVRRRPG